MFQKEEDSIHNEYYAANIRLFKIIGLLQYQTSRKEYMHTCIINIIITIGLLIQIYVLFTSERKTEIIVKSLETSLPALCFGSCYYNLLLNGAIMKEILHRIKCDWDNITDKSELEILKKYAAVSRLCTIIIAISFYIYIVFLIYPSQWSIIQFNLGMINKTELTLLIDFKYFMGNQYFYYFGNFYLCICVIIICMVGVANYTMLIAIIQHACALFDIVVWRVNENFKPKLYYSCRTCSNLQKSECIIDIIKFYNNVINFINLIKFCYEKVYLFEMALGSLFIIIDYYYLFEALSLSLNMSEELTKLSYVIASLSVIFAYCYLGQKLIDKHSEVFIKFCQIPYYSLSLRTQKMVLFLIMRSMKPCNLSMKGILIMSHYFFATLMRTSFSITMILYNLQ